MIKDGNSGEKSEQESRVFLVIIDDSEEMKVALRYASVRAKRTGGRVALLMVYEPEEFQYFGGVEKILRENRKDETEELLRGLSGEVRKISGKDALTYIRQGDIIEEIISLVKSEKDIKVVVLGTNANEKKPGPIVRKISDGAIIKFPVVVTLVPGSLSEDDINLLA